MASAAERAQQTFTEMAQLWLNKVGDSITLTRGTGQNRQTLRIYQQPALVLNGAGEVVGIECWVRLFNRNGVEIHIDPHRMILNPPLVPRKNLTYDAQGNRIVGEQDAAAALVEVLWDSIDLTPNAAGWLP